MAAFISKLIFKLIGWTVADGLPPLPKKYVLIVIPHTSNWDFPLGIMVRAILDLDAIYIGKRSLFRGPMGPIMRALGGMPVDRTKNTRFVDAVIDMFNSREEFSICISPEGTRGKVDRLKTGFYYIALGAGVPIVMFTFDYAKKEMRYAAPWMPTGDIEEDMKKIDAYYNGVRGFYPERSYGIPPRPIE